MVTFKPKQVVNLNRNLHVVAAVFVCRFPAQNARYLRISDRIPVGDPMSKRPKILIVDDEAFNVDLLEQQLEDEDYETCAAYHGAEVLEMLDAEQPDLVLLDWQMPGMSGIQVLEKIRASPKWQSLPVIMLTGRASTADKVAGLSAGADDYVTKPVDEAELWARVRAMLRISNLNQALERSLRQLTEMQHQLVMKEKMATLGSLVAGIAHEINTPVGVVISSADVSARCLARIEPKVASDESLQRPLSLLRESIASTRAAGERMGKLIDSLKNFARIDEAEFQNTDLRDGLDSTLTLLGSEIPEDTAIVREYADVPDVHCSPGQINQVFINLLRNAVQAVDGAGSVTVTTSAEDNRVQVQIADTGKGIPSEKLGHIFEPGFSDEQDRVKLVTGLSSAYSIVQQHGGDIACQSTPGQGSRFTVTLPIQPTVA